MGSTFAFGFINMVVKVTARHIQRHVRSVNELMSWIHWARVHELQRGWPSASILFPGPVCKEAPHNSTVKVPAPTDCHLHVCWCDGDEGKWHRECIHLQTVLGRWSSSYCIGLVPHLQKEVIIHRFQNIYTISAPSTNANPSPQWRQIKIWPCPLACL